VTSDGKDSAALEKSYKGSVIRSKEKKHETGSGSRVGSLRREIRSDREVGEDSRLEISSFQIFNRSKRCIL